ncbi:hypothetical protein B296_00024970 [Ensete ventricosum]|uniref:Uncharacterized protein n=1 Tax=Ensete ventricosum TaxID=4639 RepID=A0A426YM39_ENSVE|nr:hypothetical protein B296_00024970 [Ensete ventricosum]
MSSPFLILLPVLSHARRSPSIGRRLPLFPVVVAFSTPSKICGHSPLAHSSVVVVAALGCRCCLLYHSVVAALGCRCCRQPLQRHQSPQTSTSLPPLSQRCFAQQCYCCCLTAASSPRPLAASSYASSPRPVAAAKPSFDAPAPSPASPFLPPQLQPKPSPTLPPSSSSASSVFSFLCRSRLCRSPRQTPLPPSSLPSCFYRSQALLFLIIAGHPLPSFLAAIATPLYSARTLLCRCSRGNLLLGRTLLYHRRTLVPSSFHVAAIAPKHRCYPSSVPPLRCLLLSTLLTTPLPPPCCHCCPSLLSASPTRRNIATTSSITTLSTCCYSHTNSLCSNRYPSPTTQTHAPDSTAEKRTEHH